jgi:para-nitrobenzyl esterase
MIDSHPATRRGLLMAGGLFTAGLILPRMAFAQGADAIADTTAGKVRGADVAGIKAFKGIPYGADTGGKNRFLPPKKPVAWTGVRDALVFGPTAPQPHGAGGEYEKLIGWDAPQPPMGEDCLTLNVWTRGLKDGAKRPVMVSFHGGGFTTGTSSVGYDGASLVRFADVVSVTVNHRLGALGYAYLHALGAPAEYNHAGVVGLMDLVQSLEWVRDNIEAFGGDPNCVMIYGQSGGGSKVAAVYAMPSAKGLFHRAAIQSSSTPVHVLQPDEAIDTVEDFASGLGVSSGGDITPLLTASWEQIIAAQLHRAPQSKLRRSGEPGPIPFQPVLDSTILPKHPFDPTAPEVSADVPLIVSNCLEDAAISFTNFDLTDAGFRTFVNKTAGESWSAKTIPLYEADGAKTPYLMQARLETDRVRGLQAIKVAEAKSAQGRAPVFKYIWEMSSAGFGGKFGAVHGSDVGPTFHAPGGLINGDSPEANALKDKMAATWVAFARTGNPNNPAIPNWPAYDAKTRATMLFDANMRVENDPRRDFRVLWSQLQEA